jgi:hypothetical protein
MLLLKVFGSAVFHVHVPMEFGEDESFDICNISLWTKPGFRILR